MGHEGHERHERHEGHERYEGHVGHMRDMGGIDQLSPTMIDGLSTSRMYSSQYLIKYTLLTYLLSHLRTQQNLEMLSHLKILVLKTKELDITFSALS